MYWLGAAVAVASLVLGQEVPIGQEPVGVPGVVAEPDDQLDWVVTDQAADDGTQYWAIPTAVGETTGQASDIIRNTGSNVKVQQVGEGTGDGAGVYGSEKVATGGGAGYDDMRTDQPYQGIGEESPKIVSTIPAVGTGPSGEYYGGGTPPPNSEPGTFRDYQTTQDTLGNEPQMSQNEEAAVSSPGSVKSPKNIQGTQTAPRVPQGDEVQALSTECTNNPYTATCPDPCSVGNTYLFCSQDPCIIDAGNTCTDPCQVDTRYPGCSADECLANPGGNICTNPCNYGTSYMYCSGDPCIADAGGSTCPTPCTVSDTYPGCTNDICLAEPNTWKCPDPCKFGTTYPGCNTTTEAPSPDSAFSARPATPLLALLPTLLLPFIL